MDCGSKDEVSNDCRQEIRCSPKFHLPIFLISISVLQIVAYLYYQEPDQVGSALEKSYLIFNPETKLQSWRYFTYMLLHSSFIHLIYNLFVQLLVGVPLERVHGSLRILIIYFVGGLSGAMGSYLFDPYAFLVGASAGTYALITAHVANICLNYQKMEHCWLRIMAILLIAAFEVACSIWKNVFCSEIYAFTPFVCHFVGSVSGLFVGLLLLNRSNYLDSQRCICYFFS